MRLVADANVLLSAVRERVKAVLEHREVSEVLTTEFMLAKVQEYSIQLACKRRLALDVVIMAVATLPVGALQGAVGEAPSPRLRCGSASPIQMT